MASRLTLGIDVGSTTVKVVALDANGTLLAGRYARSHGRPRQTLLTEVEALARELGLTLAELEAQTGLAGCTGSGGKPVAARIGATHVNELVAQTRAVGAYYPQARTVIELGGQDSKFLSVEWDPALDKMVLADMAMNNLCAAGTGAFLDQQAERLGIAIEREFAELALQCETPARIAGRCTVFAKSDMIHLQQKGTPLPDILAGLCMALARNFKTVIGKGKSFRPPIIFQGGVAYNQAVLRAFAEVLRVQPDDLIVPPYHHLMPAIGCALVAADNGASGHSIGHTHAWRGFTLLRQTNGTGDEEAGRLPSLAPFADGFASRHPFIRLLPRQNNGDSRPLPVYLGIDVGSITTKVVLIDREGSVVARRYLLTKGRPLEAVRRGLQEVGQEVGSAVQVLGVGTTGSGRHLTADFAGGDVVRSEITAQARAALAIDPEVDTILEIGGQDSKYIRLEHGAIVNFAMNSACAAGTGSFLEEQADRLQIDLREEFSCTALQAPCPVALGERCTVFMESDLVHHQQHGAQTDDLAAGLAYGIVENYLNRVAGSRPIGKRVFFQGGVAWNDSVVAAFQARLGRPVTVPPHHDVSGAIGAALLARDELEPQRDAGLTVTSRFRGFDLADRVYSAKSFVCQACPNLCEVNRVTIGGDPPVFYGARCDMYEEAGRNGSSRPADIPDLFVEREALLMGDYVPPSGERSHRLRVGLPRTLHFYDLFPYWRAFFATLDMDLVISNMTNPATARATKDHASAETCYPVKLVFGHTAELLNQELNVLFLPAVIDRENAAPGQSENTYCPYIRAAGHLVTAVMTAALQEVKVVTSALHFQEPALRMRGLAAMAGPLGASEEAIRRADRRGQEAQAAFHAAVAERGRAVLAELSGNRPALVLVGRPYNTADLGCSQDLPYKLRKLGVLPIPLDFLPLDAAGVAQQYPRMFWRCGQDILAGAEIIRHDPRLHAVYVTSFGCGPDSFIISYFRRIMAGKPHLELELDDHTADAGILTRCEAFVESLRILQQARVPEGVR